MNQSTFGQHSSDPQLNEQGTPMSNEGLSEDEILVAQYVSSVLDRAMEKLVPDDSLDRMLAKVKGEALARTQRDESSQLPGDLRSAVLPIVWHGAEIQEPDPHAPEVHKYVFTYTPQTTQLPAHEAQAIQRFLRRKVPRKLFASFWLGAILGGMIPAAFALFSGSMDHYQTEWTIAFIVCVAVAAIGVGVQTVFIIWAMRATERVEFLLASADGELTVRKTKTRVRTMRSAIRAGKHRAATCAEVHPDKKTACPGR